MTGSSGSLKYEMYMTAFNMEDAKRVQAETDPEVLKAIDCCPRPARCRTLEESHRAADGRPAGVPQRVSTSGTALLSRTSEFATYIADHHPGRRGTVLPSDRAQGSRPRCLRRGPSQRNSCRRTAPAPRASSFPAVPPASTIRESPTVDPRLFQTGQPVLGICYGQQLMAHLLGGSVQQGR